jgi:flagellar hook protein FlgE
MNTGFAAYREQGPGEAKALPRASARRLAPGNPCRPAGKLRLSRKRGWPERNQNLRNFNKYNLGTNPAREPMRRAGPDPFLLRVADLKRLSIEDFEMGIFGAMTTAVAGLSAQSFALEAISGNVANSRTPGFRRVDAGFATLVGDDPERRTGAGSVQAYARASTDIQGDSVASDAGTHIAINGAGFFPVRQQVGFAGSQASRLYTRRGDFDLDAGGFLVNGAGHVLEGFAIDPATGANAGSALQPLRVSNDTLPARATTSIEYRANLPRFPMTAGADPLVPGSELLAGAALTGATIAADDEALFLDRTIAGQSITVYNAVGTAVDLQFRWGKTGIAPADRWSLFYLSDPAATGAAPRWTRVTDEVRFDSNGRMTNPAGAGLPAAVFAVAGAATGPISLQFGAGGLTQFDDRVGMLRINQLNQNGYGIGVRTGLSFEQGGQLVARYSNGQVQAIAQVPVIVFPASTALRRVDGGAFEQTLESGQPVSVEASQLVAGGTLEMANVDIADEFSKMIVTQQAYSANTRIITTAQQMLQDVMNIVR